VECWQHRDDRVAICRIDGVRLADRERSVQPERGSAIGRRELPFGKVALNDLEAGSDPLGCDKHASGVGACGDRCP
jgi:hypothetical protein